MGQKILDEVKHHRAVLSAKELKSMIVEMANVNTKDGIEKCQ